MENFILCAVHYAVSNENSISYIAIGFKLKRKHDLNLDRSNTPFTSVISGIGMLENKG